MSDPDIPDLVSTEWLAARLDVPGIRILDASAHLPNTPRDPRREYEQAHIPGAGFFDVAEIAETDSPLPHMLPSPEKFASRVRKLGIGDGDHIVVYDNSDVRSAARAWWMFRIFGHENISILNGGLQKWRTEGRPLTDKPPRQEGIKHFTARFDPGQARGLAHMLKNVETQMEQVLDARGEKRFTGEEPEPRAGMRAGHIPGARNLPYGELFTPDGAYKTGDALRRAFTARGVDLDRPIAASCGSGVTACVLAFGLHMLGHRQVAVYDGSWAEWGGRQDTPIETGPGLQ